MLAGVSSVSYAEENSKAVDDFLAVGRHTNATLTWTNPEREDIQSIVVYDGDTQLADVTADTGSKADNCLVVSASGGYHAYNAVFTYTDGSTYTVGDITGNLHDGGNPGWTSAPADTQAFAEGWTGAVNGASYTKAKVQSDFKTEGNYALKIKSNVWVGDTYFRFKPDLTTELTEGSKYRLSYMIKSENPKGSTLFRVYAPGQIDVIVNSACDWTQKSHDFVYDGTSNIYFFAERKASIYLDDCKLYELDENNEPVGDNLLKNGGFENTPAPLVPDASALLDDQNNAVLKLNGDSDTVGYKIWKNVSGENVFVKATVQSDVTIPNASLGDEFKVMAVSKRGMESALRLVRVVGTNIAATNFMAVGRDSWGSISWKNPERSDISEITLYNENGEQIGTSEGDSPAFNKTAGAAQSITFNAENGKRYIFKIVIKYANGEIYEGECISNSLGDAGALWYGIPKGVQGVYGWSEGVSGVIPYAKMSITSEEAHSGLRSLKIARNAGVIGNTFQRIGPDVPNGTFEEGKSYKWTYWRKTINMGFYVACLDSRWNVNLGEETPGTKAWTKFEKTFTYNGSLPCFELDTPGILYLDDVSIYKLDENGNPIGNNLLVNGNLEEASGLTVDNITNASAVSKNGTTTITYDAVSNSAYVLISREYKGNVNPYKIVRAAENSISFPTTGDAKYILNAVNGQGYPSQPVSVSVEVQNDKVEYLNFKLFDPNGEEAAEGLTDPGLYTAKATVKNNEVEDGARTMLVAAIYDGDGNLIEVGYTPATIAKSDERELTASVTMPDDVTNSYTIKAFLWEDETGLKPINKIVLE